MYNLLHHCLWNEWSNIFCYFFTVIKQMSKTFIKLLKETASICLTWRDSLIRRLHSHSLVTNTGCSSNICIIAKRTQSLFVCILYKHSIQTHGRLILNLCFSPIFYFWMVYSNSTSSQPTIRSYPLLSLSPGSIIHSCHSAADDKWLSNHKEAMRMGQTINCITSEQNER